VQIRNLGIDLLPTLKMYMFALPTLLLSIVALFWGSFSAMAAVWSNSENFSHGWLIAPISVWLIWQQRQSFQHLKPNASIWGLLGLGVCALAWLSGELARVSVVKSVAVVLMIPCSVLLFAGWQIFKSVLFPLLFLITMVPAGEGLTPILMEHTAEVLVWAVQASGIPIFREGMHFTLPSGRWSVVEACSGLRYVIAAAILALLFVYLNFSSWTRKLLFVAACLILSVLANWMRAYMIVMIGHFSQMRYGVGDDHVVYGWVFFGLVMTLIFWVGSKFGDKKADVVNSPSDNRRSLGAFSKANPLDWAFLAGALLLLMGTIGTPAVLRDFEAKPSVLKDLQASLKAESVGKFPVPTSFKMPVAEMKGELTDHTAIEVAYFARQDSSQDMLAYGQRLLPEVSPNFVEIKKGESSSMPLDYGTATEHLVRVDASQYMLLHWYVVGHSSVGSTYAAKTIRLSNMVRGLGDHSFSIVLARKVKGTEDETRKALISQAETVNAAFRSLSLE
jgi:exosortase A